ncbi:MAG: L-aspartate oxidase [Actinomycetota bacterium]|nr:FAD-dependent oxidoreductase [Actinomycetota bacterium]
MTTYDLVIVGGGVAGLCAALSLPAGARVVVIDKGESEAGSSPLAQGGMAAAVGKDDSPPLHAEDTIKAGAGLCDEGVVADICSEGPDAIAWLQSLGCRFDEDADGSINLAREGGQSVARSVHARDATGAEIVRALRTAVRGRNIERVRSRATSLVSLGDTMALAYPGRHPGENESRCVGVMTTDRRIFAARGVLLATGGAGALWGVTTNAPGATGDGIALALGAADVADVEFMQFHPTALAGTDGQRVLLTEALRGDGAILVDANGDRFVDELAPRHIVAKAILDHAPAYLDCRTIASVEEHFPTVATACRDRGLDIAHDPLPVSPAAHYFIGGVAVDAFGRSSLGGLFAAGECSSTGMHGANRLAGNSLLEAVVVGRRVGSLVRDEPEPPRVIPWTSTESDFLPMNAALPGILWKGAGPIRSDETLRTAMQELNGLPEGPHRSLALAIVEAAQNREESRGVHIRSDFPDADPHIARRRMARGRIVGHVK